MIISETVFRHLTLCGTYKHQLINLDLILSLEVAMGSSVNAQDNSESEYVTSVRFMCRMLMERTFSAIKMYDFIYNLTSTYRKEVQSLKVLHGYTKAVIEKKKREMETTEPEETDEFGIKKRRAFLDLLLHVAKDNQLTDEEIQEEVDTFMFEVSI